MRRKPNRVEEELFFERLRRGAKWVFVFLALVFGLSFVIFGVGSGSSGIGDALRDNLNFLNIGGGSGKSVGKLEEQTRKHPNDAKAFRDLATELEAKTRTDEAIAALERYTTLRPKDSDALQELAGLYGTQADDLAAKAQQIQAEAPLVPTTLFEPTSTTKLGQLYTDPNALQDPIQQAVTSLVNEKISDIRTKYAESLQKSVSAFERLAATDPKDANLQFQLGDAAEKAGDTQTAIAAYKRYLKLAPDSQDAASVRQRIKLLKAQQAQAVATG